MASGPLAHPLDLGGTAIGIAERIADTPRSVRPSDAKPSPATGIELVRSVAGMRALETEWRALEDAGAASFNFFQSFDWNMRWVDRIAAARDRIVIVVGRDHGRAVMIWPLMITRTGPVRILTWLGEPFP